MTLNVTIPELSDGKLSVKDLVISTLTLEYPLTLARLTNSIRRRFNAGVTFQGVRKAANQLLDGGVLEKRGKEYSVQKEWIWKLRNFVEQLEEGYFSESQVRDVQTLGEEITVYTFDNLIDSDQFLNRLISKWFEQSPGLQYLQKAGHAYFMVGNLEEENRINELMKSKKVEFYTLVGGGTPLDKWAGGYFRKQGFHYKHGEGDTSKYFAVYGDRLFQYETPSRLTKKIDVVYKKAKNFEALDVAALITFLRKRIALKVTVMNSPLLAEQLRNLILLHFKK